MLTSGKEAVVRRPSSPVRRKKHRRYRVLRAASPRGGPRSVDRDWAGRNAEAGVKGLSPDKLPFPRWPSLYESGEGSIDRKVGTGGVLDHGMSSRPSSERERSAESRVGATRPRLRNVRQGLKAKLALILTAEVRCPRSSSEAGQLPWSQGGHGEVNQLWPTAEPPQRGAVRMLAMAGYARPPQGAAFRVFAGFRTPVVGSHQHRADERSWRKHQPKSRVRENRMHGSVRGGGC